MAAAKSEFTAAARAALAGDLNASALVEGALRELNAARAELASMGNLSDTHAPDAGWERTAGSITAQGLQYGLKRREREDVSAFRDRVAARMDLG
jgi:HAMP domain-containing protein